jgi:FlaA1/EpsC-like NDP-sugar epimerase
MVVEYSWTFFSVIPSIILCMEILGGYKQLLNQSYTRIVMSSLIAPVVGFGVIATAMYAVKSPSISRLYILSFIVFSAVGLCTYRLILRKYFIERKAAGRYAKNVLLVGMPSAIDFMASHLQKGQYSSDYKILGYLDVLPGQSVGGGPRSHDDQQSSLEQFQPGAAEMLQLLRAGSK